MIRKVLGTIVTRVLAAVLMLTAVILNARFLGAEKVGVINLIILAITIVQMINNIVGGGALVYLVPRIPLMKLFLPSYIWGILASAACAVILLWTGSIPDGFFWHVAILSVIHSLYTVNSMILLGQERIRAVNIITVFQIVSLVGTLMIFFLFTDYREVMLYVVSLYVSYATTFLISLALITTRLRWCELTGMASVVRQIFHFGSWAQLANVFQLFNYRLSYYFIEHMTGKAALGVYSTGVQVSEGIWIIPKSMSMVQLSRITNEKDWNYAARITLMFTKLGVMVTALVVGLVLLIPSGFFVLVFGPEFSGVKPVILSLATGIVTLAFSIQLSAFFSGMGKPIHSTIASGIGLIFTIVLSLWLIPIYGIIGAGIAASVSYTSAAVYQIIVFVIMTGTRLKDFLIRRDELRVLIGEIRKALGR